ncbi:MAG: hypothetical protein KAX49_19305 [Halanaerobiales bacterium]|nr:hypothetical protein [Halanaerobiales bacterium]
MSELFNVLLSKLKNYLNIISLIFKYIIFRFIEGRGSKKYFQIIHRQFDMYIDFKRKTLVNTANHHIITKRRRKRITFWLAFRDRLSIKSVDINGVKHNNYKHFSVIIPIFNVSVNYLAIFNLKTNSDNFNLTIHYQILFSNLRDDFSTMLENYICHDEFHLFYSWYPILGNKILIKDILAGKLPRVHPTSFEFIITLSKPGVVVGEGRVTELSDLNFRVVNYDNMGYSDETPFFITGGKLTKQSFSLDKKTNVRFYYRNGISEIINFIEPIFAGIKLVQTKLNNFEPDQLNIFAIPIIAGGYGLTCSILINENAFLVPTEGSLYKRVCRLVWHEFIHHWWGNRISSEGKGRFLLTEGMTVLFEWLTAKEMFGEHYFNQIIQQARKQVLQIHGYEKSIADSDRIPPFGNTIIYKKSALVLYQLLRLIGEEQFISFCTSFVKRTGVYHWIDFLQELENYTDKDLTSFNQLWVESVDLPVTPNKNTFLYDDRRVEEQRIDKIISYFMLKQDYLKLYKDLLTIIPEPDFRNKYNYYLGICQKKKGNLSDALNLFGKIDLNEEFYYGQGLYEMACIHKEIGNYKEYQRLITRIVTGSYLFDDPRYIYNEYRNIKGL